MDDSKTTIKNELKSSQDFNSAVWKKTVHEPKTSAPPLNRKARRISRKRTKSLNRAIKRFVETVIARSPTLQNMDKEMPRSAAKNVFISEARKLIKKQKVALPQIMRDQGITYGA